MDFNEILSVLPHRFPFIMVDKITQIEYKKKSVGFKNVTFNEPWVQGHFPNEPILPGVLIIEIMAQISGFAFYDSKNKSELKAYLCKVKNAKFIKKVLPGDVIWVEATVDDIINNIAQVSCIAKVNDKTVATGILTYAFDKK